MADAEILSQQEEATATDTATDTATATTAAVETNDANDDTQPPLQEDQQQPPSSPPSSFDGDGSPDPEAFVNNGASYQFSDEREAMQSRMQLLPIAFLLYYISYYDYVIL